MRPISSDNQPDLIDAAAKTNPSMQKMKLESKEIKIYGTKKT